MTRPLAAGILRPSPAHAYTSEASYNPTKIKQAMHTMTLNPDPNWYADTGATNHMANMTGKISTYFNNNGPNHIVVGNDSYIPIHGSGHTTLPPPSLLSNSIISYMLLILLKTCYLFVALQQIIPLPLNLTLLVYL